MPAAHDVENAPAQRRRGRAARHGDAGRRVGDEDRALHRAAGGAFSAERREGRVVRDRGVVTARAPRQGDRPE